MEAGVFVLIRQAFDLIHIIVCKLLVNAEHLERFRNEPKRNIIETAFQRVVMRSELASLLWKTGNEKRIEGPRKQ